jgi:hypothetical protein
MCVYVDEPGRHDKAGRVDHVSGGRLREHADGCNPSIHDSHIAATGG